MENTKKLGTLHISGDIVLPLACCHPRDKLLFADTVPGKELEWVDAGDMLVATKCVCRCISWNELNRQGYIFGRVVRIDGKAYLCRSLRVGNALNAPNEWDDLLARFGESNELWDWAAAYFWGQEDVPGTANDRAIRGYDSPRAWRSVVQNGKTAYVGFRPVLEPLSDMPDLTGASIGSRFAVYGPNNVIITGQLAGADDYDIVLKYESKLPAKCGWVSRRKDMATLQRDSVLWMEELKK